MIPSCLQHIEMYTDLTVGHVTGTQMFCEVYPYLRSLFRMGFVVSDVESAPRFSHFLYRSHSTVHSYKTEMG